MMRDRSDQDTSNRRGEFTRESTGESTEKRWQGAHRNRGARSSRDARSSLEGILESLARQKGNGLFERIVNDIGAWADDSSDGRGRPRRDDVVDGSVDDGYVDEQAEAHSMRGRGPKNYRRSEQRILDRVVDALQDDTQLDATDIEVTIKGGDVVLDGHVRSRQDKHRAENIAAQATGRSDVDNRIRVKRILTSENGDAGHEEVEPGGTPGEKARDEDDYGHP